jgi:hypothetical protein
MLGQNVHSCEELQADERDRLIDDLARRIVRWGLETPAIMFLEMHKPVAFLASQCFLMVTPLVIPLLGRWEFQKYSALLGSPEAVELLIQRIESLAEEQRKGKMGS